MWAEVKWGCLLVFFLRLSTLWFGFAEVCFGRGLVWSLGFVFIYQVGRVCACTFLSFTVFDCVRVLDGSNDVIWIRSVCSYFVSMCLSV